MGSALFPNQSAFPHSAACEAKGFPWLGRTQLLLWEEDIKVICQHRRKVWSQAEFQLGAGHRMG